MQPNERDRLVIAGCVIAASGAMAGVVLIAQVEFPTGFGGVPGVVLVAALFLVRKVMAVAHHRRTLVRARRQARNN